MGRGDRWVDARMDGRREENAAIDGLTGVYSYMGMIRKCYRL